MSSVTIATPPMVKTVAEALRTRTFACSQEGCDQHDLLADRVRVPDLLNLYLGARYNEARGEMSGAVDERYPLSAAEIAKQARCFKHLLAVNMFPLDYIGKQIDRMIAANIERLDAEQTEAGRAAYLERQKRRQGPPQQKRDGLVYSYATRPVQKPVSEPVFGPHLPAHAKPANPPKPKPEKYKGPKRYGDERKPGEPVSDAKGKGKKGKQKDNKKKQKQGRA